MRACRSRGSAPGEAQAWPFRRPESECVSRTRTLARVLHDLDGRPAVTDLGSMFHSQSMDARIRKHADARNTSESVFRVAKQAPGHVNHPPGGCGMKDQQGTHRTAVAPTGSIRRVGLIDDEWQLIRPDESRERPNVCIQHGNRLHRKSRAGLGPYQGE